MGKHGHHGDATRETTPFVFYKSNVAEAAGVSIETLDRFSSRLHTAFEMGEPVWMLADEIRLRAAAPKKHKSPRELAVRVVALASREATP